MGIFDKRDRSVVFIAKDLSSKQASNLFLEIMNSRHAYKFTFPRIMQLCPSKMK